MNGIVEESFIKVVGVVYVLFAVYLTSDEICVMRINLIGFRGLCAKIGCIN